MLSNRFRRPVATLAVFVSLTSVALPALGALPAATLTGRVFGEGVSAPLAGATVVVTAANGTKLASQPTGSDGSFTVAGIPPGTQTLILETKDGAFAVATPITLAPGETRDAQLAIFTAGDEDEKKKKKGAAPSPSAKAAMAVTIVGFAVMGALAIDSMNSDDTAVASPSQPPPDGN